MVNFCPNCGNELKTEFKYCPSCGFDLREIGGKQLEIIDCENCGTENPAGTEICTGCGIKLKVDAISSIKTEPKNKTRPKQYEQKNKKRQSILAAREKEIDSKKIIGIAAAVLLICLVILFSAGVFDKHSVSNISTNVNQSQSSVDLSAIQRINELEATVKANPANIEALLELAHLRNDSGMFEKAIENYREYLNKVPENADARIDMGVCYYNLRKYDEAIIAMTEALRYNTDHQIGHLNLGIVNLAAGNIEKSKEWLQKAVALGPENDIGKRAKELLTSH